MPPVKPRILYVDDDESARLALTLLFGRQGYQVTAVSNSQTALLIVSGEPFDLYILGLPGTDGTVFSRKIREVDSHIPSIIYSDVTCESEQESSLCAGVNVFIAKPRIDKLLDTVRAELEF